MNEEDYVDVALTCANVCTALDRGLRGKLLNELNTSVRGDKAIDGVGWVLSWSARDAY